MDDYCTCIYTFLFDNISRLSHSSGLSIPNATVRSVRLCVFYIVTLSLQQLQRCKRDLDRQARTGLFAIVTSSARCHRSHERVEKVTYMDSPEGQAIYRPLTRLLQLHEYGIFGRSIFRAHRQTRMPIFVHLFYGR